MVIGLEITIGDGKHLHGPGHVKQEKVGEQHHCHGFHGLHTLKIHEEVFDQTHNSLWEVSQHYGPALRSSVAHTSLSTSKRQYFNFHLLIAPTDNH
ncbi:hypothetical protein D3C73_1390940 [compost metagenome]